MAMAGCQFTTESVTNFFTINRPMLKIPPQMYMIISPSSYMITSLKENLTREVGSMANILTYLSNYLPETDIFLI